MPVVTPSLASMDSVNAVPKLEVFSADIWPRRRWSRRSSVMARQTRPRPYLAMKLVASGVIFSAAMVRSPSFSRSSSSQTTIMRPARSSESALSTSVKIGLEVINAILNIAKCKLDTTLQFAIHIFCHPERSEGPAFVSSGGKQVLRFAQDDNSLQVLRFAQDDNSLKVGIGHSSSTFTISC